VLSFALQNASFRSLQPEALNRKVKGRLMAISQDLLEILACPLCKSKVELKPDGSGLKCLECHRVYPIRDDIPVMLVDEATIENETEDQPQRS